MKSTVAKTLRITGIVLVVSTVIFIIGFVADLFMNRPKPESTAIIGGADRPTAILITSRTGWIVLLTGGILIAGIGLIIIPSVIIHRMRISKRKNKS